MTLSILLERVHDTHPIQWAALGVWLTIDAVGLMLLCSSNNNNNNKSALRADPPWPTKRRAYYSLLLATVLFHTWLDTHYAIDTRVVLSVKFYAVAFPIGLLDLHFSKVSVDPWRITVGFCTWCFCGTILPQWLIYHTFWQPEHHSEFDAATTTSSHLFVETILVRNLFTWTGLLEQTGRFFGTLIGNGLLADLAFSPLHRWLHKSRWWYQNSHAVHHEYTQQMTSLALYHGSTLDDWLMPLATTIGIALWYGLYTWLFDGASSLSNVTLYLIVPATLLSHAHTIECAQLLAPDWMDDLNFVSYHHHHHTHPNQHFGLTKPSDLIWDWVLGVNTITSASKRATTKATTTQTDAKSE